LAINCSRMASVMLLMCVAPPLSADSDRSLAHPRGLFKPSEVQVQFLFSLFPLKHRPEEIGGSNMRPIETRQWFRLVNEER
jgi:hypothetical protein